jgi:hypothetical protein
MEKSMTFKVGDIVRCIDPHFGISLVMGGQYVVTGVSGKFVDVRKLYSTEVESDWLASRFELVRRAPRVGHLNNMEKSMSREFKVSDRVKCIEPGNRTGLRLGVEYVVEAAASGFVRVRSVDDGKIHNGWSSWRFELVRSAEPSIPGRFILIFESPDGIPAPAPTPRVYTSEKQASTVAEAMSQKHPGGKFVVWKAFGESFTPLAETTFKTY